MSELAVLFFSLYLFSLPRGSVVVLLGLDGGLTRSVDLGVEPSRRYTRDEFGRIGIASRSS